MKVKISAKEVVYCEGLPYQHNFLAELYLNIVLVNTLVPLEEEGFLFTCTWRPILYPILFLIANLFEIIDCLWERGIKYFSIQTALVQKRVVYKTAYPEQYEKMKEIFEKKGGKI